LVTVYLTVSTPYDTPVRTAVVPEPAIVAIEVVELDHVPPAVGFVKVIDEPKQKCEAPTIAPTVPGAWVTVSK
jgi:hypothetical protein